MATHGVCGRSSCFAPWSETERCCTAKSLLTGLLEEGGGRWSTSGEPERAFLVRKERGLFVAARLRWLPPHQAWADALNPYGFAHMKKRRFPDRIKLSFFLDQLILAHCRTDKCLLRAGCAMDGTSSRPTPLTRLAVPTRPTSRLGRFEVLAYAAVCSRHPRCCSQSLRAILVVTRRPDRGHNSPTHSRRPTTPGAQPLPAPNHSRRPTTPPAPPLLLRGLFMHPLLLPHRTAPASS